jgi:DNA-binding LacI/PurR family transcriptional regulator
VRGGHERIAFIAGAEDSSTNRDREAGFYRGLAEHGVTAFERAVGNYTFEGASAAARHLMARRRADRPDAIFVANDHMAFAVMDVIRTELGLSIPDDVSVVGFDDVPEASWKAYDLTSVTQSSQAMTETTVDILLEQIETSGVKKRAAVLPAALIVRGSARKPG